MTALTQIPLFWQLPYLSGQMGGLQEKIDRIAPVDESAGHPSTYPLDRRIGIASFSPWLGKRNSLVRMSADATLRTAYEDETYQAKSFPQLQEENSPDAAVIQIWEGKVIGVDQEQGVMHVLLEAKLGNDPPHTGDIELQWVAAQDIDLVRPGAIFYLTLYKRTKRGTIENAQELRFRRLPTWSRHQLARVKLDAEMVRSKMKARPIAE